MDMVKIHYLDCSEKQNRILLVKSVMKAIKTDEKPSKEKLEKISKKIGEKYKIKVQYVKQYGNKIILSINCGKGFSVIECKTYYEALCKYILFVKESLKLDRKRESN